MLNLDQSCVVALVLEVRLLLQETVEVLDISSVVHLVVQSEGEIRIQTGIDVRIREVGAHLHTRSISHTQTQGRANGVACDFNRSIRRIRPSFGSFLSHLLHNVSADIGLQSTIVVWEVW